MANLTRSKIAYDFNISPHKLTVPYPDEEITFIFSSNLYKEKFREKIDKNRDVINTSLSNRFGVEIVNDKIADLRLYQTIEKRGFLIYKGQVKIECLNNIKLDGNKMIVKN